MQNRIKELRKNAHLTQTEFGERVGVKGNTVANYELGMRVPSDAVILAICREFGVNENWLRTGEGDMYVTYTREEAIAAFIGDLLADEDDDNFKLRLIRVLAGLNEKEWISLERNLRELFADKKEDPLNGGSDAQ